MRHIWQLSFLRQVHRIVSLSFSQSEKKLNNRLLLPPRNILLLRCIFLWLLTLCTANMLQLPGDFARQKKFHSVRLIQRFFLSTVSEICSDVRTSESALIISTNMLSKGSCFTIFPLLAEKISPSL